MAAEDEGIVPPEPDATTSESSVENQPDNPAWSDFLGAIPPGMHDMVRPHLRKWDEGVNQRINQVHEGYADWKPFKDAGVSRETLEQAYGIWQAINDNPQEVYRILGESYGYGNESQIPQQQNSPQGQINPQQENSNQPSGDEYALGQGGQFNPEIARLQAMTENMAQIMLQQHQAQQAAREEAEADSTLDRELSEAKAKHGNFDERFVLSYVNTGMSVDSAVEAYKAMRNEVLSSHNRPGAPNVISGSGALPSQQVNPAKLNDKDTRSLVAEMVKASRQQG